MTHCVDTKPSDLLNRGIFNFTRVGNLVGSRSFDPQSTLFQSQLFLTGFLLQRFTFKGKHEIKQNCFRFRSY